MHHSKSLEFRAELIVLLVMADEKIGKCEKQVIENIAQEIYKDEPDRARVLFETIHEFHEKIIEHNGLDYSDLITKIRNDIRKTPRFAHKINISQLDRFRECIDSEEDKIFHDRIIEFLSSLKKESMSGKL